MALGDLMVSRFSHSSSAVSNHLVECTNHQEDVDRNVRENNSIRDSDTASSSYGHSTAVTVTSMAYLPQTILLCELRHEAFEGCVPSGPSDSGLVSKWRPRDRMKTGCVALVLCLNISVDPPDVIKILPCARMECWIDPFSMAPQKALDTIGKTLSYQYERWQARAKYKIQLDPTIEEVKKLCHSCRKYAKSERVLFHYNGHGVPKPTANGEIWLFNKSYTQYIPLPISDLDSWLKTPSIYVFDCSAAGMVANAFIELQDWTPSNSSGPSVRDCILLAACEAHESLPQSVEFPADVFTSCLTTPIKMALRCLAELEKVYEIAVNGSDDEKISAAAILCGAFLTRGWNIQEHTVLFITRLLSPPVPADSSGESYLIGCAPYLNVILLGVTTVNCVQIFSLHGLRLFRQDLLVASLFQNFLLAERIMSSANCSPVSYPMLPPTHQHHMWDAWDMAAKICLAQLPVLVEDPNAEF